jgi:geranylgeranyl pyrophosphate synthase
MMAAACSERPSETNTRALDEFARAIGLAFQIQDDLLDIEGDATLLGKATGADSAHHKPTYPSSVGVEAARRRMNELHAHALASLAIIGPRAATLASVSDWLVLRKY